MCRSVLYRVTTLHEQAPVARPAGKRGRSGVDDSGEKAKWERERTRGQSETVRRKRRGEGGEEDNLLCCQYVAHNDRLLDFSDTAIIAAADLGRSSLA